MAFVYTAHNPHPLALQLGTILPILACFASLLLVGTQLEPLLGQIPTGQIPTGQIPTGQIPTGQIATGPVTTGQSIEGKLLKPNGDPAVGIRVFYNRTANGSGMFSGSTQTDSQGRFSFRGLTSPSLFTMSTPPPFAPIFERELPVGSGKEVVVIMEPEGVIRLRAIDAVTRQPIPEFQVRLGFTTRYQQSDLSAPIAMELLNPGKTIAPPTKEFRIGQLPPGTPFQVTVSAKGYAKEVLKRVEATLEKGGETVDVALQPETPSMLRDISGILTDSDGRPVGGAKVKLIVGEENPSQSNWLFYHWMSLESGDVQKAPQLLQYMTTTSSQNGSFKFSGVRKAKWIEIIHSGGHTASGRHQIVDPEDAPSLDGLELVASYAGTLVVAVDQKKFPTAFSIRLEAKNWATSPTAYAFSIQEIPKEMKPVTFDNLPPSIYQISLQTKPENRGMGNVSIQILKTIEIEIAEEDEKVFEFK